MRTRPLCHAAMASLNIDTSSFCDAILTVAPHRRSTGPKFGPTNFQTLQIVRESALSEVAPACLGAGGRWFAKTGQLLAVHIQLPGSCFARICKPFRNTRPRSAADGQDVGEPTPIFRGRCDVLSLPPACHAGVHGRPAVPREAPNAIARGGFPTSESNGAAHTNRKNRVPFFVPPRAETSPNDPKQHKGRIPEAE